MSGILSSPRDESYRNFIVCGRQLYSCGHADSIGQRTTMEDATSIIGEFAGSGTQYFAIFDGHGGPDVALYCADHLHRVIAHMLKENGNVEDVIVQAFAEVNKKAAAQHQYIGCTAAVVLVMQNIVYAANVGDSRIVLVENGRAVRISVDHKTSDPEEAKRVIERGGHIVQGRLEGVLAVTRAIGDGALAPAISCEPHLKRFKRRDGTRLIIACDGIWDVIKDEEAAEIIKKRANAAEAARVLKDEALQRGTTDNVTCVVVNLTPK